MSKTANRIIKNTFFLYAKTAITLFLTLFTTRVVLNGLGASDFGIFGIVGSAIGIVSFLKSSLSDSTLRFLSYAEGSQNGISVPKVFANSLFIHIIIAVFLVLILELSFVPLFDYVFLIPQDRVPAAMFIYHCAVGTVFISIISSPFDSMLNAHENMLYYSLLGIFDSFFKLGCALLVFYLSYDRLCLYGLLMMLTTLIITLITYSYCKSHYCNEVKFRPNIMDMKLIKEMGSFLGWTSVSSATWSAYFQGNAILLNHFFGTLYNAAHSIAYQIGGQLTVLGVNMLRSINPVIVKKAGAGKLSDMYKITYLGDKMFFFLVSICYLPFFIYTEQILQWWLVNVPVKTELFVKLYLTSSVILSLGRCLPLAIKGVGRIRYYELSFSAIFISSPILIFILFMLKFPVYTLYLVMIGAAVAYVSIILYFSSVVCRFPLKDLFENDILRSLLPFCIAIMISIGMKNVFEPDDAFFVIINIFFCVVIYTFLYYYLAFMKSERKLIVSLVLNVKDKLFKPQNK